MNIHFNLAQNAVGWSCIVRRKFYSTSATAEWLAKERRIHHKSQCDLNIFESENTFDFPKDVPLEALLSSFKALHFLVIEILSIYSSVHLSTYLTARNMKELNFETQQLSIYVSDNLA